MPGQRGNPPPMALRCHRNGDARRPARAPRPDWVITSAGLLARGSQLASGLPGDVGPSGILERRSPLTVAGAAAASEQAVARPSPLFPFHRRPRAAGTEMPLLCRQARPAVKPPPGRNRRARAIARWRPRASESRDGLILERDTGTGAMSRARPPRPRRQPPGARRGAGPARPRRRRWRHPRIDPARAEFTTLRNCNPPPLPA